MSLNQYQHFSNIFDVNYVSLHNLSPNPFPDNILSKFSPIPQFDGLDDLPLSHNQLDHSVPLPACDLAYPGTGDSIAPKNNSTFVKPTTIIRKESYSLDRTKQLKKIGKDSLLSDFEIDVSPSNENVNIQCSVGFYTKVAIPAFESISAGGSTVSGDICVKCHDVTKRTDVSGAATANVIMYRLYQQNLSIGQVTVHLYHTTRNVQVQGSALLPDNTKAPIWFVNKILREAAI